MFCVIVYFNADRTDYLVFGPYKSHDIAHGVYMTRISKRWHKDRVFTFEVAQMIGE